MNYPIPVAIVLALSIVIQAAAAIMAFRLIRITGRRPAWSLIVLALALMAVRRVVPLYHLITGDLSHAPDFLNEVIGLALSTVMAVGIARIAPIFAERKQAEDALRESVAFQGSLLDAIPIPVFYKDRGGQYIGFNKSYETFLGVTKDQLIGKSVFDISPPELAKIDHAKDTELIEGGGMQQYESQVKNTHGVLRDVIFNKAVFADGRGNIGGLIGAMLDITERKQAEAAVLQLNAELEQRVAQRTVELETAVYDLENFNYSASHDLRIPLRAVDGFSKILLDEYSQQLDDEGKRLLRVVRDYTKKMAQLIDDMQEFSRTGRMVMVHTEVDMDELVHEVVAEFKPAAVGRELKLEIHGLPPVCTDRDMMRRVIVNLLSNAIKFTRPKTTALIEVGARSDDNETIYYIKDNGVGFDMQYADKLFGVFQRLHGPTEFEGTGIGLAIVKRIITRLGGRVWAEGKVNEGATIYFALPMKEVAHG
jgi:PAS domain S-box-containing protein